MVIEPIVRRLKRRTNICKVHDPAGVRLNFTAQMEFDAKRVTVEPRTFVPFRHMRQPMSGFDGKRTENIHEVPAIPQLNLAMEQTGCRPMSAKLTAMLKRV